MAPHEVAMDHLAERLAVLSVTGERRPHCLTWRRELIEIGERRGGVLTRPGSQDPRTPGHDRAAQGQGFQIDVPEPLLARPHRETVGHSERLRRLRRFHEHRVGTDGGDLVPPGAGADGTIDRDSAEFGGCLGGHQRIFVVHEAADVTDGQPLTEVMAGSEFAA